MSQAHQVDPPDQPSEPLVYLSVRTEPELLEALDREAVKRSRPGHRVTRSDVARSLLWDALGGANQDTPGR